MRALTGLVLGLIVTGGADVARAETVDPAALFSEAVRLDLSGEDAAPRAFELYRKAAEAGLPAAEFNVAVMFDSGRGTPTDMVRAATWYARAAAHGDQRAAYNLGQLYENGQGVPRNIDLARAWFKASNLTAAQERLSRLSASASSGKTLAQPRCVVPAPSSKTAPVVGGIELVWTSDQQPEPVRFFVEIRQITPDNSTEVFSGFADTSSLLAPVAAPRGSFAWRVTAVGRKAGVYVASDWTPFSVAGE